MSHRSTATPESSRFSTGMDLRLTIDTQFGVKCPLQVPRPLLEWHASKLEYLGVVAGMKGWCRELGERQKVEIVFSQDVSTPLPLEMGLPLFRVLQEAVHNDVKHSGTRQIEVQLHEDSGEIPLIVSDSGKGFDVGAAARGQGLGLTSMRERISLVNGSMIIDSKLTRGTRIHVRVPFPAEHHSSRTDV
jgi:signal transduction histidine kinase